MGNRYTAEADNSGIWRFDLRFAEVPVDLAQEYSVWSRFGETQSERSRGFFTVKPLLINGFEGTPELELQEAQTTGLVIEVTGPAGGAVCVDSIQGHYTEFPLDESGVAVKRLIMHAGGFYMLNFRPCTDGFVGGNVEKYVDVYDSELIFGPFGIGGEQMFFEIL